MMELIQRYYTAERHTAMLAIGIGVLLILMALILWPASAAASLARGMAYVFLVAGLFQTGAGLGYAVVVGNRSQEAAQVYSARVERDIKQLETARMEALVKSGYIGGLAMYTGLLLSGLVLLLLSVDAPTRKGVALALMIVGVLGCCLEAYSMRANRQYLQAVAARTTG
jgi:vacuolar-type H+-ATPase subunit I/STV1